ncbi:MAG: hypothetical protein EA422_00230 [Gemmatimonadales bacterium]|nr:MAG: hypothetical protein EA422_00230 [Gemmatimonadales bacterium]
MRLAPFFLLSLLLPLPALTQTPGQSPFQARVGAAFETYQFAEEEAVGIRSLSLFSVPVAAAFPLGAQGTVEIRSALARGSMETSAGETVEVSGLTDTEVRVGFRIPGAVTIQLQAIGVLPTGNATHTEEEAVLAGAVASDLLPFRVSNWGAGGGGGGLVGVSRGFGATAVGVSASYLAGRAFEPLSGESFAYRPGDHLRIRGALDHDVEGGGRVTVSLTLDRFSDDLLDEANLYRAGNRIQTVASYSFRQGRTGSGVLYGGVFHRSQGTALLEAAPSIPSQQLLLAGGGLRRPTGGVTLVPTVDVRVHRTEDGVGQGWLPGVGLGVEIPAGGWVVVPTARGRYGRILVREGSESAITGFELSLIARPRR